MQKRFINYKASVDSFPIAEKNIGVLKPGRYNGYDTIASAGGQDVSIGHSGSIRKTNNDGTDGSEFGALVMPTGIIIHDTDNVLVTFEGNPNATARRDLVICEHDYQEIEGGNEATYSIVKGPTNGNLPSLPDPSKQVILGVLTVTGSQFSDVEYTPQVVNLPGDIDSETFYNTYIKSFVESYVNGVIDDALEQQGEVITITDHVTLNASHNGKVLRILNTLDANENLIVTIPQGLPLAFHCGMYQDDETLPGSNGISHFQDTGNIKIQVSNVKLRNNLPGSDLFLEPGGGFMAFIQGHMTVSNYYVIMGNITDEV